MKIEWEEDNGKMSPEECERVLLKMARDIGDEFPGTAKAIRELARKVNPHTDEEDGA